MRNISFFLTQPQIRARTKTVTRRLGWKWLIEELERGETVILQPIVKGQGLKKGEKAQKINGPIRVKSARLEPLNAITAEDVLREGFPGRTPDDFVKMFCAHNDCEPNAEITRMEFDYVCL